MLQELLGPMYRPVLVFGPLGQQVDVASPVSTGPRIKMGNIFIISCFESSPEHLRCWITFFAQRYVLLRNREP